MNARLGIDGNLRTLLVGMVGLAPLLVAPAVVQASGACCQGGTCSDVTSIGVCEGTDGGLYQGDGTACSCIELGMVQDFEGTGPWGGMANGAAVVDSGSLRLTQNMTNQVGSFVFESPSLDPLQSFDASFQFKIGPSSLGGADGLSFVLMDAGIHNQSALFGNAGLGSSAMVVRFDTHPNGSEPSGNFAQIRYNGTEVATAEVPFNMDTDQFHHVAISFDESTLTLNLTPNGGSTVLLFDAIAVPGFVPFVSRYGFGASTGAVSSEHRIDNVDFINTSCEEVSCPAPTGGDIYFTEYINDPGEAQFFEITNRGTVPVDLSGWSYDDDSRTPGTCNIGALGILAPGESAVLTDFVEFGFRVDWGLPPSVKLLANLGQAGPPNENCPQLDSSTELSIYDASATLVSRLSMSSTAAISWWPCGAPLDDDDMLFWVESFVGGFQGEVQSFGGAVGSPGNYVEVPCVFGACCAPDGSCEQRPDIECGSHHPFMSCEQVTCEPPPDADGDGVPDANDICPNTGTGVTVDELGCPLVIPTGDCDQSGLVDLADYTNMKSCLIGPSVSPATGCECFDLDSDNDIDLMDFATFSFEYAIE